MVKWSEDSEPSEMAQPFTLLRVEEAFAGMYTKEVEISGSGTNCDVMFKEGERYLVYAYRSDEESTLYTSICSGSGPLREAKEDLQFLRGAAKAQTGATISGSVDRLLYDWSKQGDEGPGYGKPLVKAKVIFESASARFEALTNNKGDYELRNLPQGRYTVRTDPVTNYSNIDRDQEREPKSVWEMDVPARGCVVARFSLIPEGEVSGTIDNKGRPLDKDLDIELVLADYKTTRDNYRYVNVDQQGRFRFKSLPPGRYLLGFNIRGGPSMYDRYQEYYYPGVAERSRAEVITLADGQKVGGLVVSLPEQARERVIEGVAVWPNGEPAVDVRIELTNPRTGYDESDGVFTDSYGRFKITGIEGQTYELSALVNKGVPLVNSKPLVIKVGEENRPVRLVIEVP